jgi:hypothetical protein
MHKEVKAVFSDSGKRDQTIMRVASVARLSSNLLKTKGKLVYLGGFRFILTVAKDWGSTHGVSPPE